MAIYQGPVFDADNHYYEVKEHGLKETLRRRDEPFGEGFARVGKAEGRR